MDAFILARKLISNEASALSVSWDADHLPPAIRALGDLVEYCRIMECRSHHCGHHKYPSVLL